MFAQHNNNNKNSHIKTHVQIKLNAQASQEENYLVVVVVFHMKKHIIKESGECLSILKTGKCERDQRSLFNLLK